MIRIIFITTFLWISSLCYGQNGTENFQMRVSGKPVYPELILKIDTLEIVLDSISIKTINPDWIKQIEVVKNGKMKNQYDNKDGIVFIYPKRKFWKRLLKKYKSD